MSAAALRRPTPPGGLAQARVVALLLAAGAWVLTDRRMGGMDSGPGSELGGLSWFAVTWALMMAAMMLPRWPRWWPRTVGGPWDAAGRRPSRPAISSPGSAPDWWPSP